MNNIHFSRISFDSNVLHERIDYFNLEDTQKLILKENQYLILLINPTHQFDNLLHDNQTCFESITKTSENFSIKILLKNLSDELKTCSNQFQIYLVLHENSTYQTQELRVSFNLELLKLS